jgi:hypothetical protein
VSRSLAPALGFGFLIFLAPLVNSLSPLRFGRRSDIALASSAIGRLITDFNQIEIGKALTVKMRRVIFDCCMQDLNPLYFVKLGAIPQPILATIALMAESHNVDRDGAGEDSVGDCVDFEHMEREQPRRGHRGSTKE